MLKNIQQSLMEEKLKSRFLVNSWRPLRCIIIWKLEVSVILESLSKNLLSIILMFQQVSMMICISHIWWTRLGIYQGMHHHIKNSIKVGPEKIQDRKKLEIKRQLAQDKWTLAMPQTIKKFLTLLLRDLDYNLMIILLATCKDIIKTEDHLLDKVYPTINISLKGKVLITKLQAKNQTKTH